MMLSKSHAQTLTFQVVGEWVSYTFIKLYRTMRKLLV